ncbi:hypothetical protein PR048_033013 [Dryococelus australis]|uniref:DUF4743 domain-containing protein n=1 Tax=Dryococelus australis TaxID=614101 RepID=A0ABQ9G7Z3_9NEOP|nr:hypothetical protein PR048_033013 [Dryococelus australis]
MGSMSITLNGSPNLFVHEGLTTYKCIDARNVVGAAASIIGLPPSEREEQREPPPPLVPQTNPIPVSCITCCRVGITRSDSCTCCDTHCQKQLSTAKSGVLHVLSEILSGEYPRHHRAYQCTCRTVHMYAVIAQGLVHVNLNMPVHYAAARDCAAMAVCDFPNCEQHTGNMAICHGCDCECLFSCTTTIEWSKFQNVHYQYESRRHVVTVPNIQGHSVHLPLPTPSVLQLSRHHSLPLHPHSSCHTLFKFCTPLQLLLWKSSNAPEFLWTGLGRLVGVGGRMRTVTAAIQCSIIGVPMCRGSTAQWYTSTLETLQMQLSIFTEQQRAPEELETFVRRKLNLVARFFSHIMAADISEAVIQTVLPAFRAALWPAIHHGFENFVRTTAAATPTRSRDKKKTQRVTDRNQYHTLWTEAVLHCVSINIMELVARCKSQMQHQQLRVKNHLKLDKLAVTQSGADSLHRYLEPFCLQCVPQLLKGTWWRRQTTNTMIEVVPQMFSWIEIGDQGRASRYSSMFLTGHAGVHPFYAVETVTYLRILPITNHQWFIRYTVEQILVIFVNAPVLALVQPPSVYSGAPFAEGFAELLHCYTEAPVNWPSRAVLVDVHLGHQWHMELHSFNEEYSQWCHSSIHGTPLPQKHSINGCGSWVEKCRLEKCAMLGGKSCGMLGEVLAADSSQSDVLRTVCWHRDKQLLVALSQQSYSYQQCSSHQASCSVTLANSGELIQANGYPTNVIKQQIKPIRPLNPKQTEKPGGTLVIPFLMFWVFLKIKTSGKQIWTTNSIPVKSYQGETGNKLQTHNRVYQITCEWLHKGDCRPFIIEGHQVGLVRPDVMRELLCYPDIFHVHPDGVELNPAFRDYTERTARIESFLKECRANDVFVALKGWRDESGEDWATLNYGILRVNEGEVSMEQHWIAGVEMGKPTDSQHRLAQFRQ